jgi:hypothetical protein
VTAKALALPADHDAGLDECQGFAPARPEPRQPRSDHPIGQPEARSWHRSLVYRELMPQRQVFQV